MSERKEVSASEASNINPTICRWTLLAIVNSFDNGITIDNIKQCIHKITAITYDRDKNFFFWLGKGLSIKSVINRMERRGLVSSRNKIKKYVITSSGQEILDYWISTIIEKLCFESLDEFQDAVKS